MSILERIMALFHRREPEPETTAARELAQRISAKADELSEHFKRYQRTGDPFAAMLADMYTRDQISRIHRGPKQ